MQICDTNLVDEFDNLLVFSASRPLRDNWLCAVVHQMAAQTPFALLDKLSLKDWLFFVKGSPLSKEAGN